MHPPYIISGPLKATKCEQPQENISLLYNATYSFLKHFLFLFNKVDDAQTDEDINSLLDDPKYSTIVNRSGWPVGRVLNLKSKGDFITSILVEELVDKRIQLLQNFREGLDHFSLLKLMKESPNLWKPFFLTEGPTPLSADVFMNLVEPPTEPDELQAKAYELFLEFSKDHVDCTGKVNTLLCIVV